MPQNNLESRLININKKQFVYFKNRIINSRIDINQKFRILYDFYLKHTNIDEREIYVRVRWSLNGH